jgi:hypothetical protein
MLDLVKQEAERIDSRFLEPACGHGNFLAEILQRAEAEQFLPRLSRDCGGRSRGGNRRRRVAAGAGGDGQSADEELTEREKRELTEAEKEYKTKRKQIQEKLIKFATRIPIFMYLTDYRERALKDVITQLEPGLFKKVTGLSVKDFELLVSLGVFNSALMNDAIYKFKRYEDPSLIYTGVCRHEGEDIGLFDTALSAEDFRATFESLASE